MRRQHQPVKRTTHKQPPPSPTHCQPEQHITQKPQPPTLHISQSWKYVEGRTVRWKYSSVWIRVAYTWTTTLRIGLSKSTHKLMQNILSLISHPLHLLQLQITNYITQTHNQSSIHSIWHYHCYQHPIQVNRQKNQVNEKLYKLFDYLYHYLPALTYIHHQFHHSYSLTASQLDTLTTN